MQFEPNREFQNKIDSLDIDLFARIPSQTTDADKRMLLAVQKALRNHFGRYVYLEIGSHLGGSIQPHLLDPNCTKVYSIDSRPESQPDARGTEESYPDNSSERMLQRLRQLSPDQADKVVCFDSRAQDVSPCSIEQRPQLCFIDGEHTDRATTADFEFCLSVSDCDAVIVFHDADLVYGAIKSALNQLRRKQVRFAALKLAGSVYVISMGRSPVGDDPEIRKHIRNATLYLLKSRVRLAYRRYRNKRRNVSRVDNGRLEYAKFGTIRGADKR